MGERQPTFPATRQQNFDRYPVYEVVTVTLIFLTTCSIKLPKREKHIFPQVAPNPQRSGGKQLYH
jgi:hypothetical protein